ncbi:hypothetical protein KIW84_070862 [Lathyrus oleraceus]|uniref:Uncharacterized protein n=1 Tax=Pisum sativum TaxID=3888 RepID=A0A9D4VHW6_PEA|nr:hypothetical protein KIW84_070862 [Pisum sativum]
MVREAGNSPVATKTVHEADRREQDAARASLAVSSSIPVEELMSTECGDSSFISLLPSGFSILSDGHSNSNNIVGGSSDGSGNFGGENDNNGRLLTERWCDFVMDLLQLRI